jgi:sRNA-binding regulator protein Hfq
MRRRKSGKNGALSLRTQQEVYVEVERLEEQGMPRNLAVAVARGKLDLNQALERMVRSDRVDQLVRRHQLNRGLAMQVVLGQVDLDKLLWKRRFEEYKQEHFSRSFLVEASGSGDSVVLGLYGGRQQKGSVAEVSQFDLTFVDQKGVEATVRKIDIKFAYLAKDWKEIGRFLKVKRSEAAVEGEPILKPQNRFRCSDQRLFRIFDEQRRVEIRLLEGERLSATLAWISRYECGLRIGTISILTVFRHALSAVKKLS